MIFTVKSKFLLNHPVGSKFHWRRLIKYHIILRYKRSSVKRIKRSHQSGWSNGLATYVLLLFIFVLLNIHNCSCYMIMSASLIGVPFISRYFHRRNAWDDTIEWWNKISMHQKYRPSSWSTRKGESPTYNFTHSAKFFYSRNRGNCRDFVHKKKEISK